MSEASERTTPERLTDLERRLEEMDDVVAQRCLAILDATDAVHRQTDERLDRLTERVDQLAVLMAQSIESANADRAIIRENQAEIRRIWEYLLSQHPNGNAG